MNKALFLDGSRFVFCSFVNWWRNVENKIIDYILVESGCKMVNQWIKSIRMNTIKNVLSLFF